MATHHDIKTTRGALLFSLALLAFSASAQGPTNWRPSEKLIGSVEASLTMPANTSLRSYRRYYYGQVTHGHRLLMGTYVLSPNHAGVQIVSPAQSPKIFDGGCSIINMKYDVERKKVVSIFCNGAA
ncbi:hypothetical protein [Dyella sp. S184]|uniref:hypothetical protein n=1 Tax=Dyella sp. S184 TaxID=1641862 RepID=UPI00131CAD38|nr:hypothetical protein [Dyella sp. S184]